jgi:polyisoprenyl-phosphate glycosyltransferase
MHDASVADFGRRRQRAGSPDFLLSVIVPMHNEEEVLGAFFSRIIPVLKQTAPRFEILCIDDGSTDDTVAGLVAAQQRWPEIRIITLARNFGKEAALTAGLDLCEGDAVVPIDADLQDPPELMEEFVKRWRAGADVVVGVRVDRSSDSVFKRVSARWFYKIFNKASDTEIPSDAGDYRLMDKQVIEVLRRLPERTRFMKGIFAWVGFKQDHAPYTREVRNAGEGKWKPWKLWNFALEGIFSFTTAPLRVWTYVGLLVAAAAFLFMVFLIVRTLALGADVPGYASLAVLILFSLSFNLVTMGILGEYVGRIYTEVKGRPLYIVRGDSRAAATESQSPSQVQTRSLRP